MAEFFVVYIREAHAADSEWPIPIAGEEAINKPKNFSERAAIATKCMTKLNFELPCLVDDLKNSADNVYHAWPDRLFLVDNKGKIVVRGDQGPWGFKPSVDDATEWLGKQFPKIKLGKGS